MFKLGTFEKAMFYKIKERGLRAILFNLFIMLVKKLRPAWRGEVSCPRSVAGLVWNLGLQFLAHLLLFFIPQHLFLSSATSVTCEGEVTPRVTRDLGLEP